VLRGGRAPDDSREHGHDRAAVPGRSTQRATRSATVGSKAAELAVQILCQDQRLLSTRPSPVTNRFLPNTVFGNGTAYLIGSDITPGTYKMTASTPGEVVQDCYWERATTTGEIIDNNVAGAATEITVTRPRGRRTCGTGNGPTVSGAPQDRVSLGARSQKAKTSSAGALRAVSLSYCPAQGP
jgi:hypothetical protein